MENNYRSKMEWESSRARVYRNLAILVIVLISVYLTQAFIAPVLVGFVFSAVLFPLYKKLYPEKLKSTIRGLVVTVGFAIVFLIPIGGLIFVGADAALDLTSAFKVKYLDGQSGQSASDLVGNWLNSAPMQSMSGWLSLDYEAIRSLMERLVTAGGTGLAGLLKTVVSELPQAAFAVIIILITTFFGLVDGPQIIEFLKTRSPFSVRNTNMLFDHMQDACRSSIVATAMTGLIQALLLVIAALVISFPHIWLIGLAAFLLSFVPMIGTAPLSISIVAYLALQGDSSGAIVFLVMGVLAGVSDNITRPYFLQGRTRIHPLAGLVFTFGAIGVIGFPGLFLGPVMAGLVCGLAGLKAPKVNLAPKKRRVDAPLVIPS